MRSKLNKPSFQMTQRNICQKGKGNLCVSNRMSLRALQGKRSQTTGHTLMPKGDDEGDSGARKLVNEKTADIKSEEGAAFSGNTSP